jgi:aryl-alcohol dehydrogenase-like predicted oxidoreductase
LNREEIADPRSSFLGIAPDGVTSAIVGATSPEQLRDTLGGVSLELDAEELEMCDRVWYEVRGLATRESR